MEQVRRRRGYRLIAGGALPRIAIMPNAVPDSNEGVLHAALAAQAHSPVVGSVRNPAPHRRLLVKRAYPPNSERQCCRRAEIVKKELTP